MKTICYLIVVMLVVCSCEKVSPNAVKIGIDYQWKGHDKGNGSSPQIALQGVPQDTKTLTIQLIDLDSKPSNHGGVEELTYDGKGIIPAGTLKKYIGPSPPPQFDPHLYEFTIKALNEEGVVIGIGKKAKHCCEQVTKSSQ